MSSKIRRNDPCPCGSGKKYKHCCMNSDGIGNMDFDLPMNMLPLMQPPREDASKTIEYMKTHEAADILNLIVALQMNPENRGANIRMERLARYATLTMHEGVQPVNLHEFKKILSEEFVSDYMEDPPTNLHSETFVWVGGNHTIYPGIATNASEILNLMNGVLWLADKHWPEAFLRNVYQAFALILSLGDLMAERAHTKGYLKGGNRQRKPLVYPNSNTDFGISDALMRGILFQRGISQDVLDAFVLDAEKERDALLDEDDSDRNPLLKKPIVKYKDAYYFLLITNQADALRRYVLEQANKYGCLNQLKKNCYDYLWQQLLEVFYKMLWRPVNIDTGEKVLPNTYERVFQFDRNCYAYVCFVHDKETKDNAPFFDITEHVLRVEEKILNQVGQDKHYMSIVLFASMGETSGCTMSKEPIHPILLWSAHVFVGLAKAEHWERFDLFHYADACHRMGRRLVDIDPIDTYAIYKQHTQSFYVTDEGSPLIAPSANMGYLILMNHKKTLNYHAVERLYEEKPVYVGVVRESEDMPLYQPLYSNEKSYLQCIDNGAVPIWVSCEEDQADIAAIWGEAILYWLHYIIENEDITVHMHHSPQEIKLHIIETPAEQPYRIERIENGALLSISFNAVKEMTGPDNSEERKLIAACIDGLTNTKIGAEIVDKYIPLGEARMMVCYVIDALSEANPTDLLPPLLVVQASQQQLWDELPIWMREAGKEFRGELLSKEEKTKSLNDMVAVCLDKIKQIAAEYDYPYLLKRAIWHYDTLIWKGERDKVHTPAKIVCFGKNEEQINKIRENELRLVRSSLGLRCLIEYLASQPYIGGTKYIGDYDLEYLVTIMCEAIYYGSICDQVYFDVGQVRIAHLPSGRYGINQDQFEDKLFAFHGAYSEQLIDGMIRDYPKVYARKLSKAPHPDDIQNATNAAFQADWGVSFQEIGQICGAMSTMCVNRSKSVLQMPAEAVVAELREQLVIDESTIRAAIDRLSLQPRETYLKAPDGYGNNEVYPWRYNREFSFSRRFIVKTKDSDGVVNLIFGQRNALAAFKQLIFRLVEGQLNVPDRDRNIKKIVGRYSEEKGKAFNDQVRAYLKEHTDLDVAEYDVPIDKEHFPSADKNYGDIDVLAYDKHSGIAYNIECKDTVMAKNIYQMHIEIRKYLGLNEQDRKDALIWKHYRRHEWLCLHKKELADFLRVEQVKEVKSVVLTSAVLPVSFLRSNDSPLPIVSYHDLEGAQGDLRRLV